MANLTIEPGGAMAAVRDMFIANPVMVNDMRRRMRGRKVLVGLSAYALALVIMAVVTFVGLGGRTEYVGGTMFAVLYGFQVLVLSLFVPMRAARSIAGEVENGAIDALVMTRMSSLQIVVGKQMSAFLHAIMLVGCSVPLAGLCLLLGGLPVSFVLLAYLLLSVWAFVLASFSILCSTMFSRALYATVVAFAGSLGYMAITSSYVQYFLGYLVGFHYGLSGPGTMANVLWYPLNVFNFSFSLDMEMPVWIVVLPAVNGLLFAWVCLLVAASRIKYRKAKSALALRLLLIARSVILAWFLGELYSMYMQYGAPWSSIVIGSLTGGVLLWICVAIPLCTGEIRKRKDSLFRYVFSWRRMFVPDVGGALGFLLVWASASYLTLGLSLYVLTAGRWDPVAPHFWASYIRFVPIVLSLLIAVYGLGVLASSIFKRRATAIGVLMCPAVLMGMWDRIWNLGPQAFSNGWHWTDAPLSGVIWPSWAIIHTFAAPGEEYVPWWSSNAWIVGSVFYIIIGILSVCLASVILARTGGIREDEY